MEDWISLDGKSRVGNLIDVGEQPFEPKGCKSHAGVAVCGLTLNVSGQEAGDPTTRVYSALPTRGEWNHWQGKSLVLYSGNLGQRFLFRNPE